LPHPPFAADEETVTGFGDQPGRLRTTEAEGSADLPTVMGRTPDETLAPGATRLSTDSGPTGDRPEKTGPLTTGQAFGSRYHIIRVLGIGGRGAVYQAWDAELGIAVALKVIRPEATGDAAAAREMERRFKQELVLARQVTHKNVVRIHDLGEIDGIKYITMPYLEGSDLASTLREKGKLPLRTALRLVRDIASGLVAAHEAGIVHRDLKPANIMVLSDRAVIMDFGIARSSGGMAPPQAGGSGIPASRIAAFRAAAATMVGTVLGTVEYMAPEQAQGRTVDQRADIYALGLIFSDVLLGKRHTTGHDSSAVAELMRRIEQAPPKVRTVDPSIPETVEQLISGCLAPDPAARFQTSAELVARLDRLDENGLVIPEPRRLTWRLGMAAAALLALMLAVTSLVTQRAVAPVEERAPVSVVIADFDNRSGDPTLDRTLEPMLRRALEGASFISAYDRNGVASVLGVRPPEQLDEGAARELAVKQGVGVVLSGALERRGNGYRVSVKAAETVTGNVITTASGNASNRDQLLGVATELMVAVRRALGESSDSAQIFAMASLSATSLDVVRHYAEAMEAASNGEYAVSLESASRAVELDPKFGIGYQVMAVASRNLGRLQDADKYINEALRYLDGMTERERFSTRGMFYRVTGDYEQCVREYGDLIERFGADVVARNQLALCSSKLRNLSRAVAEMRTVVELLPNRVIFRDNLALYANYAGDFQTGEEQARAVQASHESDVHAGLALAFAQLGHGQIPQAIETYRRLEKINPLGASFATLGLADAAVHDGRFSEAARMLEDGAAADLSSGNPDRAAAKLAALAYARLQQGRHGPAVAAADAALGHSPAVKTRFLAARTFVEAGEIDKARALAAGLGAEFQAEPRALAKIIEGNIALAAGDTRQAVQALTDANALLDTWLGHFELGRAFLAAGQFAQADSEFDRCFKRRGEALSLFLDEEPTYGHFPLVHYYQGRVRENLKNEGFVQSYRAYLEIRGRSSEDPLLKEVSQRAGG
jgi:tetratricopeptide (TPR) repeat protein